MLFGGIDVGSLSAQAVILENGSIRAYMSMPVKPNPLDSASTVLYMALERSGMEPGDLSFTVSTGYGREQVQKEGLSQSNVSEISAHGKGAHWLLPAVRTVIDIGGQDAKVIRVDQAGELQDFVMNDKCAAGTGRFLEVMARTLGVSLEELGPLSFQAHNPIELSTRCSIYCETEVLHYIQRGGGHGGHRRQRQPHHGRAGAGPGAPGGGRQGGHHDRRGGQERGGAQGAGTPHRPAHGRIRRRFADRGSTGRGPYRQGAGRWRMITLGVDVGSLFSKAVVLRDEEVVASEIRETTGNVAREIDDLVAAILKKRRGLRWRTWRFA